MAAPANYDGSQMGNFLNSITYENYVWKTKYNELWQNFLTLTTENTRLTTLLNQYEAENQCMLNSVESELENNASQGVRKNIVLHLQNKNTELIKTILNKDTEIAALRKEIDFYKRNIPNSPPLLPPTPPVLPPNPHRDFPIPQNQSYLINKPHLMPQSHLMPQFSHPQ